LNASVQYAGRLDLPEKALIDAQGSVV
jgi:hypothetical protein